MAETFVRNFSKIFVSVLIFNVYCYTRFTNGADHILAIQNGTTTTNYTFECPTDATVEYVVLGRNNALLYNCVYDNRHTAACQHPSIIIEEDYNLRIEYWNDQFTVICSKNGQVEQHYVILLDQITCSNELTVQRGAEVEMKCSLPYEKQHSSLLPILTWTTAAGDPLTSNDTSVVDDENKGESQETLTVVVEQSTSYICRSSLPQFSGQTSAIPIGSDLCSVIISIQDTTVKGLSRSTGIVVTRSTIDGAGDTRTFMSLSNRTAVVKKNVENTYNKSLVYSLPISLSVGILCLVLYFYFSYQTAAQPPAIPFSLNSTFLVRNHRPKLFFRRYRLHRIFYRRYPVEQHRFYYRYTTFPVRRRKLKIW